jgi:hypothetical protein
MNERIKLLAEQANLQDGWFCGQGNIEKFAQLIVADVLNEVLQAMDEGADVYYTVEEIFRVEE